MGLAYVVTDTNHPNRKALGGAQPFLKWAGGKTQLLPDILVTLPDDMEEMTTYIEPFLGGGAVYFKIIKTYPNIKRASLIDISPDVITTYMAIRDKLEKTISILAAISNSYQSASQIQREIQYYKTRDAYNISVGEAVSADPERAAQFIFLNKTCFNGLYRVNSRGKFNVPMGRYRYPTILQEDTLRAASYWLQKAELIHGDFAKVTELGPHKKTFIYYDPPYRPLSNTSCFNAYDKSGFNDKEQKRLAQTFRKLHLKQVKQMLSNSDPKHLGDMFFENLYEGFALNRVYASRMINSESSNRGRISELLVTNY